MQALIDFDGWRKWKDFAAASDTTNGTSKISTSYRTIAGNSKASSNLSPTSANALNGKAGPMVTNGITSDEKKSKRKSLGVLPPPSLPEEDITPPFEGVGP
jgi:osomolarity two-component system response regulator SSK1